MVRAVSPFGISPAHSIAHEQIWVMASRRLVRTTDGWHRLRLAAERQSRYGTFKTPSTRVVFQPRPGLTEFSTASEQRRWTWVQLNHRPRPYQGFARLGIPHFAEELAAVLSISVC